MTGHVEWKTSDILMQVAAFLVLGILRIRCILWKEYECLRIHNKYIQVYMNFRQGWIRISSQGSEKLPECIETNPICYQFWMKKEESSLAKKIQPNHANLVRNYLSFNRLKHAIFYLVFCFSETGIVCDQGVKIPTFSIFLFFMEFWQNEVRVGNRHAQS